MAFVSCLAIAPVFLLAQRPVPVPPGGLTSAKRAAPDALKKLGAETFQLTVGPTGAVQISLFDSASALLGTATLHEEVRGTRFRYSYRHNTGKEASVAVAMQEAQDQVTSTMRSSNGRTLTLVIEQDAAKKSIQGGKVGLKRVRAHDGREWKVFTAADLKWQPPGDCVTAQADKPRGEVSANEVAYAIHVPTRGTLAALDCSIASVDWLHRCDRCAQDCSVKRWAAFPWGGPTAS